MAKKNGSGLSTEKWTAAQLAAFVERNMPAADDAAAKEVVSGVHVSADGGGVFIEMGRTLWWAPALEGPFHQQQGTQGWPKWGNEHIDFCGDEYVLKGCGDCGEVEAKHDKSTFTYRPATAQQLAEVRQAFVQAPNAYGLSMKFRKPEYLFQLVGTQRYIVTTNPVFGYGYDQCDVFMGEAKAMIKQEGPVAMDRMRDGGTTHIRWGWSAAENLNKLYCPSPLTKKGKATLTLNDGGRTFQLLPPVVRQLQDDHDLYAAKIAVFCRDALGMDTFLWTHHVPQVTPFTRQLMLAPLLHSD